MEQGQQSETNGEESGDEGDFICSLCARRFTFESSCIRHQKYHEKRIYSCPDCGKSFIKHQHLKTHSYMHTKVAPYKCDQCEKRFTVPSKLKRHSKVHEGYACEFEGCSTSKFEKWSDLRKHCASEHKTFVKCDDCGKQFRLHSELKRHERKHSNNDRLCPIDGCEMRMAGRKLAAHLSKEHFISGSWDSIEKVGSNGSFNCHQCSAVFDKKGNLEQHIRSVHLVKPETTRTDLICPIEGCNRVFSKAYKLKYHKNVHDGINPFNCTVYGCEKAFPSPQSCRRHVLEVHGRLPHASTLRVSLALPKDLSGDSDTNNNDSVVSENES